MQNIQINLISATLVSLRFLWLNLYFFTAETHSFQSRHIGFESCRVGNINKYFSVKSSLKLRVSQSNFVFFARLAMDGFYVLKVFQHIYSFYLDLQSITLHSTHCFSLLANHFQLCVTLGAFLLQTLWLQ